MRAPRRRCAIGLANRVVPHGASRAAAEELARQLAAFPQEAMRRDRRSALERLGLPLEDALAARARSRRGACSSEAREGARRFAEGEGRHGAFDG